jgi:hypothetical protein
VQAGVDGVWVAVQAQGNIDDSRVMPTWYNAPVGNYDIDAVSLNELRSWPVASVYLQEIWEGPLTLRGGARTTYTGATSEVLVSPRAGLSVPLPTGTVPKLSWGIYHHTPADPRVLDARLGNPDIGSSQADHYVVGIDQGFPLPGEDAGGLLRVEA